MATDDTRPDPQVARAEFLRLAVLDARRVRGTLAKVTTADYRLILAGLDAGTAALAALASDGHPEGHECDVCRAATELREAVYG